MATNVLLPAFSIIQFALGVVFLWSGIGKAKHPVAFVEGLNAYEIGPSWLNWPVAVVVIAIEILIAISHLLNTALPIGIGAAIVVLTAFIFVLTIMLRRGATVRCLCFGATSTELISLTSLVRLSVLLIGEGALALEYSRLNSWPNLWQQGLLEFSFALICGVSAVLLGFWFTRALDVVRLSQASGQKPDASSRL
jgi:hypothetical protein